MKAVDFFSEFDGYYYPVYDKKNVIPRCEKDFLSIFFMIYKLIAKIIEKNSVNLKIIDFFPKES